MSVEIGMAGPVGLSWELLFDLGSSCSVKGGDKG